MRPSKARQIHCHFQHRRFCAHGNEEAQDIMIGHDLLEALRLVDAQGASQDEAARSMDVSTATLCRILGQARQHVATALCNGHNIIIEGGNVKYAQEQGRHRNGMGNGNGHGCTNNSGRGNGCGNGNGQGRGKGPQAYCAVDGEQVQDAPMANGQGNGQANSMGGRMGRGMGQGRGQGRGMGQSNGQSNGLGQGGRGQCNGQGQGNGRGMGRRNGQCQTEQAKPCDVNVDENIEKATEEK